MGVFKMKIIREKGLTDVPVYMRDYTEQKEYSYTIEHLEFKGEILKLGKNWWIVSNAKWVVMGKATKKEAEREFQLFVEKNHDLLKEKGYIKSA